MDAFDLLIVLVVFLAGSFLWDQFLDWLNMSRLSPDLPPALQGIYEPEKYRKSQEYIRTKARFGFLTSGFSFALTLIVLAFGLLGWLDDTLRPFISNEKWLALAFFGILYLANDLISLPFSLYNIFVIEEKFGFNKMTLGTFVVDKLKNYALTALLGGGILFLLIFLIEWLEADFWIWFWGVSALIMVGASVLFPTLILPLFNKLQPLEEGELKEAIDTYASSVDFPVKKIMVMDGSKRSAKSNAFFAGFGRQKRIVLFDTLIAQHSVPELVAILAHETGHYKKKHIIWSYLISMASTGLLLFLLSRMVSSPVLSEALGGSQYSIHLNLIAFGFLYSPVSELLGLGMNAFSRKNEYEADAYATDTYDGKVMLQALVRIHTDNLSNLNPHPWYVFWHYSHPTLLQRMAAIESRMKQSA
ncbi:MAG: M48 family metallopeptidase [Bacteroidia bacterium]|nr:M48 family metallopeptidase [Bacteroidia bacterium]